MFKVSGHEIFLGILLKSARASTAVCVRLPSRGAYARPRDPYQRTRGGRHLVDALPSVWLPRTSKPLYDCPTLQLPSRPGSMSGAGQASVGGLKSVEGNRGGGHWKVESTALRSNPLRPPRRPALNSKGNHLSFEDIRLGKKITGQEKEVLYPWMTSEMFLRKCSYCYNKPSKISLKPVTVLRW